MHTSSPSERFVSVTRPRSLPAEAALRRRARTRRREQIRRRRAVALTVFVALVALAIWAAYAVPGQTPARVPQSTGVPGLDQSPASNEGVVVATIENDDVLLPVARDATTAIAYHPVDSANTVPFSPAGDRVGGGTLGQKLADIFAGGGGVQYYLMDGGGGSSSLSGLDVGAVPGSTVVSPVSGKVTAVKKYQILGRYTDVEIDIRLASDPSLLLVVTHIAKPQVQIGAAVTRGEQTLGVVRGFPASLDQALSRYTSDTGDHVQLMMLRVTPELAGL
jgi:hypothetical protein